MAAYTRSIIGGNTGIDLNYVLFHTPWITGLVWGRVVVVGPPTPLIHPNQFFLYLFFIEEEY